MKYVVDASVAVEFLLRTPVGRQVETLLAEALLIAPELLDIEVLSVLRWALRQKRLDDQRAALAVTDLAAWPVERIPHRQLVLDVWALRHNLSAYDACYVAAAQRFDAVLITADGPLSRAPNLNVPIHVIRCSSPS